MDTDLRPVFSRKFCFCPESRKAIHTQHFKLRIKLLLGRRVIDAQGGTCQNFDRDARPTFLGLKFGQILFFCIGKFLGYFSGFCKISAIFLGLTNFQLFFWVFQFLCHTLQSFAWRTHSTEKHTIIVAFHIYSNFDKHCILSLVWVILFFWVWILGNSIFLEFEFRVILLFWVVEICSRSSIPFKEMLVCPPSGHWRWGK